jgi:hypothetical protein
MASLKVSFSGASAAIAAGDEHISNKTIRAIGFTSYSFQNKTGRDR